MNADIATQTSFTNNGTVALNANLTTGTDFINNGITTLSADKTITTTGGLIGTTNGVINIADGKTLSLNQNGMSYYTGSLSGGGKFEKNNSGTLILDGAANSINLAGGLVINNGEVWLSGADNSLASTMNVTVNKIGDVTGKLVLISGNQSINSLSGAGNVNINNNNLSIVNGGSFTGKVYGTGRLYVADGTFTINNISSDRGTFSIGGIANTNPIATVSATKTLTFPTVEVNSGGKLDVQGSVNASQDVVVSTGGTLHLGNYISLSQDNGIAGSITTAMTSVSGTLSGNGTVSGTTTVQSGGIIAPGNSPGIITVDTLTLNSGSISNMEIIHSGAREIHFDQITVTGSLNIESGSTLNIIKYTTDPNARELTMGEKVKIFNFTPGNISGYFTNATSTYSNDVILNLQTGEVVGLGGATISSFENSVSLNNNIAKILSDVKMNETSDTVENHGSIAQYYGGEFASRLAANQGNNVAIKNIYESFSPEAYAGLLEQNKFDLLNSISKLPTDLANAKPGVFISFDRNTYETDKNNEYVSYQIDGSKTGIDYLGKLGDGFVATSFSGIDGNVKNDKFDAKTKNYGLNIATVQPIGSNGLSFRAQASYACGTVDVSRKTYDSVSYANNIDTFGALGGFGLGYEHAFEKFRFIGALDVLYYNSHVDGFVEKNNNTLDALNVFEQKEEGAVSKLKLELMTNLGENVSLSGNVKYNKFYKNDLNTVSANVAVENVEFGVKNNGLGKDIIGLGTSIDFKASENLSAGFNAEISGDKDLSQNYNLGLNIKYSF